MWTAEEGEKLEAGLQIESWFSEYNDDIYNYLVYYTGSLDVEDLVQEVFIKALKGMKSFKGLSTPKTWLFTIARNTALDYYRKKKHESAVSYDDLENFTCEDRPGSNVMFSVEMLDLYNAVNRLNKNYRDVVILRGIRDLSSSETAEILKWSETRVNVTLHRALKSLRKELYVNPEGGNAYER